MPGSGFNDRPRIQAGQGLKEKCRGTRTGGGGKTIGHNFKSYCSCAEMPTGTSCNGERLQEEKRMPQRFRGCQNNS